MNLGDHTVKAVRLSFLPLRRNRWPLYDVRGPGVLGDEPRETSRSIDELSTRSLKLGVKKLVLDTITIMCVAEDWVERCSLEGEAGEVAALEVIKRWIIGYEFLKRTKHFLIDSYMLRKWRKSAADSDLFVPSITVLPQLVRGVLGTLGMLEIVRPHIRVTVEAHGNAILKGVNSAFGLVNNMVTFDLGTAKLVADATVSAHAASAAAFTTGEKPIIDAPAL